MLCTTPKPITMYKGRGKANECALNEELPEARSPRVKEAQMTPGNGNTIRRLAVDPPLKLPDDPFAVTVTTSSTMCAYS